MSTQLSEFQAAKAVLLRSLDQYEAGLKAQELPEPSMLTPELTAMDDPDFAPSPALFRATQNLVSSLGKLNNLVQNPAQRILLLSFSHLQARSLAFAAELQLADELLAAGEKGVSVEKLGPKIKVHPKRLIKIFRTLANDDIFKEVKEGVFANNRASLLLTNDSHLRSFSRWQAYMGYKGATELTSHWSDPAVYDDFSLGNTSWAKSWGFLGKHDSIWSFLPAEHPSELEYFGRALVGYSAAGIKGFVSDYDFTETLGKGSTIVDVGGGIGGMLLPILKYNPTLKGVLTDLPHVVPEMEKNFKAAYPAAIEEQRISFEAGDYYAPQPENRRKKEGIHFALRWIIHDLPDHKAIEVLKQIADALHPKSKVLIVDYVIKPAIAGSASAPNEVDTSASKTTSPGEPAAPWPLLESYGRAQQIQLLSDIEMGSALNAQERTESQFAALLDQAGLKLDRVVWTRTPHPVLEASLK